MSGGGKGGGGESTVGFKYFLGLHMGLCRGPVNELVCIRVGDRTAWAGSMTSSGAFSITAGNLFGGESGEGGVEGVAEIMMGEPTQTPVGRLYSMLAEGSLPAYRGVVSLFFDGLVSMMNPYPKPWKMRVRRSTKGWSQDAPWNPGQARIILASGVVEDPPGPPWMSSHYYNIGDKVTNDGGKRYICVASGVSASADGDDSIFDSISIGALMGIGPIGTETGVVIDDGSCRWKYVPPPTNYGPNDIHAMNPAHIIYECLTNRQWGRKLPAASLDATSFAVAAQQLYAESFGLCLKWSKRETIQTFMQTVLDHIGAVIYTDRSTALITLKLIRGNYVTSSLPLFDAENGLLEVTEATSSSIGRGINQVQVTYTDALSGNPATVTTDNLAAIQASGGQSNQMKKSYPGLPNAALAMRVAQRDLRVMSTPLKRFTFKVDRRGRMLYPGSVVRIKDLTRDIPDTVVRVGKMDDSGLTDGQIQITAVQDVFSLPTSTFIDTQDSLWQAPISRPCVADHRVMEVPYIILARTMKRADFNVLDDDSAFYGVVSEKGQPLNASFRIATRVGASTSDDTPFDDDFYCGYTP